MNAIDLAFRLGLRKRTSEWRGTCPSCGYDAFRAAGRADQPARVRCWSCNDVASIGAAVTRVTAGEWIPPSYVPRLDTAGTAERTRRAIDWWDRAIPAGLTPVAAYLANRGLAGTETSLAIRYAPSVTHPTGGPRLPAMIARVQDAAGDTCAIHRTYLTLTGRKADVDPVKASMGIVAGGAIRLAPYNPLRPLVVGEGIESAASAGLLLQAPAWAAVAAGNLAATMALPDEVRTVTIAADPDEPGRRAAEAAAERWQADGRTVRIARLTGTADWNDTLCRELRHG